MKKQQKNGIGDNTVNSSIQNNVSNTSALNLFFAKTAFWVFLFLFVFIYFALPSSYEYETNFEVDYSIDIYETTPESNEVDSSTTTI